MISIVWTKSNRIGSLAIREISDSKSSHVAWILDKHLVFHSNHKGCHVQWIGNFLKENEIVWQINLDLLTLDEEEALYLNLLKYDGKPYDFAALYYMGIAYVLKKLHLAPLPKINQWSSKNRFMCVELLTPLNKIFGVMLPPLDTTTPDSLYAYLNAYALNSLTSGRNNLRLE